jgi:hypothetical protein
MGLFSKKKKVDAETATDDAPAAPAEPPTLAPAPTPARLAAPAAPAPVGKPPKKSKKNAVDPNELLNLRAELMEVKARLMAAEQSRSIVESRLAALDATALALSNDQSVATGASERLADLEARVVELGRQPVAAAAPSDDGQVAALQASLQARIDELAGRVDQAGTTDPELLAKLAMLEAQVAAASAAAEAALTEVHNAPPAPPSPLLAMTPLTPTTTTTDPEVLARLDDLTARVALLGALDDKATQIDDLALRVAQIDVLTGQLSQLNARVTAQAEFGAQLSSMRDRITELQQQSEAPVVAPVDGRDSGADDELREAVAALTMRMAATELLADQLRQLADRVDVTDSTSRQTHAQVAALEQRIDSVGQELANQISELGRDIDGLAERTADVASGTVSDEVMAALRGGQIKLANEQARYEIAFREDLAALAEQVRRNPPRT